MGDVIAFPEPYDCGAALRMARLLDLYEKRSAEEMGTPEQWGQSAAWYLLVKRRMVIPERAVTVSAEAIDFILAYVDSLTGRRENEDFPRPASYLGAEALENAIERLATSGLKEGVGDVEVSSLLLLKAAVETVFACAPREHRDAYLAAMPGVTAAHAANLAALDAAGIPTPAANHETDDAA